MSSTSYRILTMSAAAALATATITASADARFLMTRAEAVAFARSDVTTRYLQLDFGPDSTVRITCRRSRKTTSNPHRGPKWHRWICDWKATTLHDQSCIGSVGLIGSAADTTNNDAWRWTVSGARCSVAIDSPIP